MTMLKHNDYVSLLDGSNVVIESVEGDEALVYDAEGWRTIPLTDVLHLSLNLDDRDDYERMFGDHS